MSAARQTPNVRLAKMSAAFAGSNLTRTAIAFVTSVVIARGLGAPEFGRWILFMAWASALTMVFDLGLSALVTRDAARTRDDGGRLLAGALAIRLAIFAPAGAALHIAAPWIGGVGSAGAVRAIIWLAAAGITYGCFAALFRAWPRWLLKILTIETAGVALQCAGAVLILARGGRVVDLLWLAVLVQALQSVAALGLWRRAAQGDRLDWPSWDSGRLLLVPAFPFALSGIVANAQARIAPLMLGQLATPAEVGSYGVAARLGGAAAVLPHSGLAAALPVFSNEIAHGHARYVRTRFEGILWAFAIGAAVCLTALATPIVRISYGDQFTAAAVPLQWLAIGLVPMLMNSGRKVYLYASGEEGTALRWSAVALAVQAVGCAALIPPYGAAGAAVAMAAGEATVWGPLRRIHRIHEVHTVHRVHEVHEVHTVPLAPTR